MSTGDDVPTRVGSAADLSRRMDSLERNHESLAGEVRTLSQQVASVAQSVKHQGDLYERDFKSLNEGVTRVASNLDRFMNRIEGIITGEIKTAASRDLASAKEEAERVGAPIMADYLAWRKEVDGKLDQVEVFNGQLRLMGRLGMFLLTSQAIAIVAAVYSLLNKP